MIVYGKNVFNEISNNAPNIRKIYLANSFHDDKIMKIIKDHNLKYVKADNKELDRLSKGNHQGIVVEVNEYEYVSLESILEANDDLIIVLDHLEDPHNLGAIIRTCEAAGVKSIIIPKDRSVQVNGTVMKVSAGALEYVNVCCISNIVNALNKLKSHGYFIYGTKMDAPHYKDITLADKCVLVIGNEGSGLSRLVSDTCDEMLSIKMHGQINSLNASVACAILIYGIKADL